MSGARRFLQQHPDIAIAVGLFVLASIPLLPVLLTPGQIAFSTVDTAQFFAFETTIRAMTGHGTLLPLWNPYFAGGEPVLGNHGRPVLYPILMMMRLLPPIAALNWIGVFHTWFAGMGMYLLARDITGQRAAAMVSGLTYMFCAPLATIFMSGHIAMQFALAWPGWLLFSYRRLLGHPNSTNLLLTVLFTALEVLTDHFMTALLVLPLMVAYFVYYALKNGLAGHWRVVIRGAAISILAAILAVGLTAAQSLPVLEWFPRTHRAGGLDENIALSYSLEPENLLTIALPFVWYNPILKFRLLSSAAYWESSLYVGTLSVLLVLPALFAAVRKGRTYSELWFFLLVAGFGLIACFNGSPVQRSLYVLLPTLRFYSRFGLLWAIGLSVLAGIGLEVILAHLKADAINQRQRRIVLGLGLGALLASLIGLGMFAFASGPILSMLQSKGWFNYITASELSVMQVRTFVRLTLMAMIILALIVAAFRMRAANTGAWGWLVVGAAAADMLLFAIPLIQPTASSNIFNPHDPMSQIKVSPSEVRLADGDFQSPIYLIPTVRYRTNGAELSYVNDLDTGVLSQSRRLAQLFSAAYFTIGTPYTGNDAVEVQHAGTNAYLYMYKDNWPRIYAAPHAEALSEEETLMRISDPDFDPTNTVLVITDDPPQLPEPTAAALDFSAEWTAYTPNHIAAHITANETAMVVFSETYYPGWKARIDGQPTRLYRANYAFRGVIVPPSEHIIEMDYQPASVRIGLIISAVSLIALIATCAWMSIRERSNP